MSNVFKNTHKKPKGRSSASSGSGVSGGSEISIDKDSENNASPVDYSTLFSVPCSAIANEHVIGTAECKNILSVIKHQENVISTRPKFASSEIQKFLSFHMNLLELFPKNTDGKPTTGEGSNVMTYNSSSDLSAVSYTISLHSEELHLLKVSCLDLLAHLIKHTKKSRVFSFWFAFLPGASSSPFKLGIFDLLDHTNEGVRLIF